MKTCIIDSVIVEDQLIRSNSTAFGKPLDARLALPFHLRVDASDAIEAFGSYYKEFIDRESEDEGFEEILEGNYLLLKETGYLSFEEMIRNQPKLLAQVIKDELAAEFLGYLFLDQDTDISAKKYILQTLTQVDILDQKIDCAGDAFANPNYGD